MQRFKFRITLSLLVLTSPLLGKNHSPYFLETYESARAAFRSLSKQVVSRYAGSEAGIHRIPSRTDSDLTMDSLYVPARRQTRNLIIVVSGVHGSEGFTGSALQRWAIDKTLLKDPIYGSELTEDTGFLLLHAVNPFGFKYGRRVSENNIDLNRNFSVDRTLFKTENKGYAQIDELINPAFRADAGWFPHFGFLFQSALHLASASVGEFSQTIAQGQYRYPQGIFFGGFDFAPQKSIVEKILLNRSAGYEKILVLDLHTGYGKRGYLHLLPNPPDTKAIEQRMKQTFGSYPIESSGDGSFYSSGGDFSTYVSRLLEGKGKRTVPMLFEFGTLDSDKTEGAIASLRRMILENQAYWHGPTDENSADEIKEDFREMFYPSDSDWREKVMAQMENNFPVFIERFRRFVE